MLEWWMKNCVAVIAFVLPATVVLLWLSPAIHATTLCKADDPCIREWVSALSGWVAVAAAIPTIFYLDKQVRIANKANSNNAKIALRKTLSITRRAYNQAMMAESTLDILKAQREKILANGNGLDQKRQLILSMLGTIHRTFIDQVFDRFEEEVDVPFHGVAHVRNVLVQHMADIESRTGIKTVQEFNIVMNSYSYAFEISDVYARSCKAVAEAFLQEAKLLTAEM